MPAVYFLPFLFLLMSCQPTPGQPLLLQPIASFADRLKETSGLIAHRQGFISHNDSGNPAELFMLSATGEILAQLPVPSPHHDWEDIATDGQTLYLADTGNNSGRRQNLSILSLRLHQDELQLVDRLPLAYAEQQQFQPARHQHNFDAEALAWVAGELWLFTKRWLDEHTALYKIPPSSPLPAAVLSLHAQQQLNPGMLVTGADFDAHTQTLLLLGYSRNWFRRHAWLWLYPVHQGRIIEEQGRQFTLSEQGQFEGVSLNADGFIYVSREGSGVNLFRSQATLSQLLNSTTVTESLP